MMTQTRTQDLAEWQLQRLEGLRAERFAPQRFSEVTVVVYHFWGADRMDPQFDFVESAILETWRQCGMLKTCVVVNRATPRIEAFAARFGGWVSVRANTALVPGDLPSMSIDCNANLASYFDTDYVLVIQNDGFPLRPGLEAFLGTCDFVGAPFVRRTPGNRLLGLWPRFAVGNGGFSLRSKAICERAAYYWAKRYHRIPRDSRFAREDAYYCFILPFLEPGFRKTVRFAPWEEAARFSYDSLYGEGVERLPFGFHGKGAFRYLVEKGLLV